MWTKSVSSIHQSRCQNDPTNKGLSSGISYRLQSAKPCTLTQLNITRSLSPPLFLWIINTRPTQPLSLSPSQTPKKHSVYRPFSYLNFFSSSSWRSLLWQLKVVCFSLFIISVRYHKPEACLFIDLQSSKEKLRITSYAFWVCLVFRKFWSFVTWKNRKT